MKRQTYFLLAIVLLTFVACGTYRNAKRAAHEEHNLSPLREGTVTSDDSSLSSGQILPVSPQQGGAGGGSSLSLRLDSLLLTADTLLQMTQLGMHIVDLTTGELLYAHHARQRMRPASTEKVVTAIAALDVLGPSYTLDTQLLTCAAVSGHVLQGDLYVKGVMDPLLSVADVRALATQLKAAGVSRINGRLVADASFKDDDEFGWGWCWDDENPTLSPLLCGGKPGLAAQLRTALGRAGITLTKGVTTGTAPASSRCLAAIRRPLTEVLMPMMKESDNLCAEAVFYQMGREKLARGKHYSRKQVISIINGVIENAYTSTSLPSLMEEARGGSSSISSFTIADGSGLSLYNYQTPETFTRLLSYALSRQDSIFTPLLTALPIAAVDGTLKNRMADTPAAANVRAKTGSVSAVSTLVGYTTQRSTNHLIAFAIMNNGLPRMAEGRALQDKICMILSE
ncbi:MAG: D-alanyl-D-alanine carboxypeptidase/D-alanyl-D-alanine-endopeptidase [Bacteroidaceae bacterium]|nr:D-alanyl-D-alanine carboxypeptidase/D-alanyl-D-alanine-endopeptidase [Bacteroidaceae bacterium]